ncbi:MAG: sigma-70 family RNA polymerase sigma factor [Elusimicrobiota bacterium]
MLKKRFMRYLAVLISAVYFSSQCAFAYKPEANVWDERRRSVHKKNSVELAQLPSSLAELNNTPLLNQLPKIQATLPSFLNSSMSPSLLSHLNPVIESLSPAYGTIQKIVVPESTLPKGVIVHIQDVHMNLEAQKNIGKTVQALTNQNTVNVLGLEGAFSPIDLSPFYAFSQSANQKVSQYLLREGKISGAIYGLLNSPSNDQKKSPFIMGVDDKTHYKANVKAYLDSLSSTDKNKQKLETLKKELQEKKKIVFNSALYKWDEYSQLYHEDHLSLGKYIEYLTQLSPSYSFAIQNFLEAFHLESQLNFSLVEQERKQLLSILLAKLKKSEIKDLTSMSVAYRLGKVSNARFYEYLKNICGQQGVRLSQFPSMNSYLQYVLLTDQMSFEKLFSDLKELENKTCFSLVKNEAERHLVLESKRIMLMGKLLSFSLTKDEWEEYSSLKNALSRHPRMSLSARRLAGGSGIHDFILDLSPYENFYIQANIRDEKMASHFLESIKKSNAKNKIPNKSPKLKKTIDNCNLNFGNYQNAVLVTGGFHSSGIDQRLKEAGYIVIQYTPKLTQLETQNGSHYLTVFAQEKTPLDQLFEGEKLFLANSLIPQNFEPVQGIFQLVQKSNGTEGETQIKYPLKDPRGILRGWFNKAGELIRVIYERQKGLSFFYEELARFFVITHGGLWGAIVFIVLHALAHVYRDMFSPSGEQLTLLQFIFRRFPVRMFYSVIFTLPYLSVLFPHTSWLTWTFSHFEAFSIGTFLHFVNNKWGVLPMSLENKNYVQKIYEQHSGELEGKTEADFAKEIEKLVGRMLPLLLANEKAKDAVLHQMEKDLKAKKGPVSIDKKLEKRNKKEADSSSGKLPLTPAEISRLQVFQANLLAVKSSEITSVIRKWNQENSDIKISERWIVMHALAHFSDWSYSDKVIQKIKGDEKKAGLESVYEKAKFKLVVINIPFLLRIYKRYLKSNIDPDELLQVGLIAMQRAAATFEPLPGLKFVSYARFSIKNKLQKLVKRQELLNRSPQVDEGILRNKNDPRLNEPGTAVNFDDREKLAELMKRLTEKERQVLELFSQGYNDAEIGRILNISREGVSQNKDRAFGKLRQWMTQPSSPGDIYNLIQFIDKLESEEDRLILNHFFGLNGFEKKTFSEIGKLFRYSANKARRNKDAALNKLRELAFQASSQSWLGNKGENVTKNFLMPAIEEGFRLLAIIQFGIMGAVVYIFIHAALHFWIDFIAGHNEDRVTLRQFVFRRFWVRAFYSLLFTLPYLPILFPHISWITLTISPFVAFGWAFFMHSENNKWGVLIMSVASSEFASLLNNHPILSVAEERALTEKIEAGASRMLLLLLDNPQAKEAVLTRMKRDLAGKEGPVLIRKKNAKKNSAKKSPEKSNRKPPLSVADIKKLQLIYARLENATASQMVNIIREWNNKNDDLKIREKWIVFFSLARLNKWKYSDVVVKKIKGDDKKEGLEKPYQVAIFKLTVPNMRYLLLVCKKYRKSNPKMNISELINEGFLAMRKAAATYEPDLGYQFISYAKPAIHRGLQAFLNEEASVGEKFQEDEFDFEFLSDTKSDFRKDVDHADQIRSKLDRLNRQQRAVVEMYFFRGMTLDEIGRELKLSKARVGMVKNEALAKLKELLEESFSPQSWIGNRGGNVTKNYLMPAMEEGFRLVAIINYGLVGALIYIGIHAVLHFWIDLIAGPDEDGVPLRQFIFRRLPIRAFYSLLFTLPYLPILFPHVAWLTLTISPFVAFGWAFFIHSQNNKWGVLPMVVTNVDFFQSILKVYGEKMSRNEETRVAREIQRLASEMFPSLVDHPSAKKILLKRMKKDLNGTDTPILIIKKILRGDNPGELNDAIKIENILSPEDVKKLTFVYTQLENSPPSEIATIIQEWNKNNPDLKISEQWLVIQAITNFNKWEYSNEVRHKIKGDGKTVGLETLYNQARFELVGPNIPFLLRVAKRYRTMSIDSGDLIQHGLLEMLRAAATFNPDFNFGFVTYVKFRIHHELRRFAQNEEKKIRSLQQETDDDDLRIIPDPKSLRLGVEFGPDEVEQLRLLISRLPEKEIYTLKGRFELGETLDEIGKKLGMTHEGVRKTELRAIAKLRQWFKLPFSQSWIGNKGGNVFKNYIMPAIEEGFRLVAIINFGIVGALIYIGIHAVLHFWIDLIAGPDEDRVPLRQFIFRRLPIRAFYSLLFTLPYLPILFPHVAWLTLTISPFVAFGWAFFMHSQNNKWGVLPMLVVPKAHFPQAKKTEDILDTLLGNIIREEIGKKFSTTENFKRASPHELEAWVRELYFRLDLESQNDILKSEMQALASAVGTLNGKKITKEEFLKERIQVVSRLNDRGKLNRYFALTEISHPDAQLIIDKRDKTEFKKFVRKNKNTNLKLLPKQNLFDNGVLDQVKFEELLSELHQTQMLDKVIFVLPKDVLASLSISNILPSAFFYQANFVVLEDLLSVQPMIQIRNLGLVVGVARIVAKGA